MGLKGARLLFLIPLPLHFKNDKTSKKHMLGGEVQLLLCDLSIAFSCWKLLPMRIPFISALTERFNVLRIHIASHEHYMCVLAHFVLEYPAADFLCTRDLPWCVPPTSGHLVCQSNLEEDSTSKVSKIDTWLLDLSCHANADKVGIVFVYGISKATHITWWYLRPSPLQQFNTQSVHVVL